MKRSSDVFEDENVDLKRHKISEPSQKAIRVRHRQPGLHALCESPQDSAQYDDELSRAICIGLHGAGFEAVNGRALESFRAAVEEYMHHFSARINTSMKHCRRQQPLPQDFIQTLTAFNLTSNDLLPELDVKVPPKSTQRPILSPPNDTLPQTFTPSPSTFSTNTALTDKTPRPYIPPALPPFPSKHAYTHTPIYTARETDALRIRERATQEGAQAETALRKLMAANKGGERGRRTGVRRRPPEVQWRSEELYRGALEAMLGRDREVSGRDKDGMEGLEGCEGQGLGEEEELTTAVNYDRLFWRRRGK